MEEDSVFFQVARLVGPAAMGTEFFMLARGVLGTSTLDEDGRETDLFDGIG